MSANQKIIGVIAAISWLLTYSLLCLLWLIGHFYPEVPEIQMWGYIVVVSLFFTAFFFTMMCFLGFPPQLAPVPDSRREITPK